MRRRRANAVDRGFGRRTPKWHEGPPRPPFGAVRYLLRFKLIEATPTFSGYAERLAARPAAQRADAKNAAIAKEHGLGG